LAHWRYENAVFSIQRASRFTTAMSALARWSCWCTGFASTVEHNWGGTGWIAELSEKYRAIAVDVRGHGLSDKPHEVGSYGYANMGADVTRLMDHLGIERALLMGYSMGASIAIELMLSNPERFRAIVLGGIAYDDGLEDNWIATRFRRPTARRIPQRSRVRWQRRIDDSRSRCRTT